MQLIELQTLFSQALYDEAVTAQLVPHLCGTALEKRLAIYRNTVTINLQQALKVAYPVLLKLVGERFFERAIVRHYCRAYPSESGNLEDYGGYMAVFLETFPPVASLAYLPDVARLEWACHGAYHAADAGEIDVAALMDVSPESYIRLCFSLHPSCSLLVSPYPLARIWEVNQEGYTGEIAVDLNSGGAYILVARDRVGRVRVIELDEGEYVFLAAISEGKTLYEAFEITEERGFGCNLSEIIRKNVAEYVFVAYSLCA